MNLHSWWIPPTIRKPISPFRICRTAVFRRANSDGPPSIGVAIGDHILDLCACGQAGLVRLPVLRLPFTPAHPIRSTRSWRWATNIGRRFANESANCCKPITRSRSAIAKWWSRSGAPWTARYAASGRHRRLHGFLRLRLSRHQRRQAISADNPCAQLSNMWRRIPQGAHLPSS